MYLQPRALEARQYDCYSFYNNGGCRYRSAWDSWVRWLVFGLIVGGALLLFLLFSCISARRRRKAGYKPYWGTGWANGMTPPGHGRPQYYNNNNNNGMNGPNDQNGYNMSNTTQQPYYANNDPTLQPYYNNAPPAYGQQNGTAAGYYRGENGVQEPAATYQGTYKPPEGPPPGR